MDRQGVWGALTFDGPRAPDLLLHATHTLSLSLTHIQKTTMVAVLVVGAVPVALLSLVQDWRGLVALRGCVGVLGASFVMSQAWTTAMFQRRVVGQANALVAGWGNLGELGRKRGSG